MRAFRLMTMCLLAAQTGCLVANRKQIASNSSHFGDVSMNGDEIDAHHARDVWELLRSTVPRYSFIEDRDGRALAIQGHRGRSSMLLDSETPIVVIDGVRLLYYDVLQAMPTDAVDSIEVLSGLRGTSIEGTGAAAGVIYIFTRSGASRQDDRPPGRTIKKGRQ